MNPRELYDYYRNWSELEIAVPRLSARRFFYPRQVALHNRQTLRVERRFALNPMAKIFRHAHRVIRKAYDGAGQVLEHMLQYKDAADKAFKNFLVHLHSPVGCGNRDPKSDRAGDKAGDASEKAGVTGAPKGGAQ